MDPKLGGVLKGYLYFFAEHKLDEFGECGSDLGDDIDHRRLGVEAGSGGGQGGPVPHPRLEHGEPADAELEPITGL